MIGFNELPQWAGGVQARLVLRGDAESLIRKQGPKAPAGVTSQLLKDLDQANRPVRGLQRPNQLFRKVPANEFLHSLKLQRKANKLRVKGTDLFFADLFFAR